MFNLNNRFFACYTIVEITAVIVLSALLLGGFISGYSNSVVRVTNHKIGADLGYLRVGKARWRAAYPISVWPLSESARVIAVTPYLTCSIVAPTGIVYSVGNEDEDPSAVRSSDGKLFDLNCECFP